MSHYGKCRVDNTSLNFKYGLHQLANYHQEMWEIAYRELVKAYGGDIELAYSECGLDMRCEYIKAIVQETLRLFTVLPMALPRETTGDVVYQNAVIPKGTTLFMNCWAANHDEKIPRSYAVQARAVVNYISEREF